MAAGLLNISLGAIEENWRRLDQMSGSGVETGAVVKADAYGLGARMVAGRLFEAGALKFFTATAEEGAEVRETLTRLNTPPRHPQAEIFVFSGHMDGDSDLLRESRLIPLLNSPEQITRHFEKAGDLPFGVQLDTGMNRLGLEPGEFDAHKDLLVSKRPELVMSHLACADDPAHPQNAMQLKAFLGMTDGIDRPRSLAATGGILLGPEYHFDMTRPGIGLYGGLPFKGASPVVRLDVPVIQTREVQPGESAGYGADWTANRPSRIATLAAGYADGFLRRLGGKALAYTPDGEGCEIVGRVSMDMITVDVTDLGQVPDRLSLICPEQSIDDLAAHAGTIGYEVLTSLGKRYTKMFHAN